MAGKINHFIFKEWFSGKKWKSRWHLRTSDLLKGTKCLGNECFVEIKGSNYIETFICLKKNQRSKVNSSLLPTTAYRYIHANISHRTSDHPWAGPRISIVLWLHFDFFSFKNDVNVPSNSNKQKILLKKISFLLTSWRSMTKIAGSGSGFISQETWIRGSGSGSTPICHESVTLHATIYHRIVDHPWAAPRSGSSPLPAPTRLCAPEAASRPRPPLHPPPQQDWKKPGFKKNRLVGFFVGFFGFFGFFWVFLSFFYIFAQKREFLGFFQFQEYF